MTKPKRQKGLEVHKEPQRPKSHWDHVLEEMVWLSKDFESERKWKLAQAKKVALRASKGILDQCTWGEKKLKEEEHRLRKVALNISKDVKKFWIKIEKLVLYKHQMELDEKKKKALDKQLEFLLGQTERYSTMLAENLVDSHVPFPPKTIHDQDQMTTTFEANGEANELLGLDAGVDEDFDLQSEDESEDDEQTIEADEALITGEERQEEIAALQGEAELPLEELMERYAGTDGKQIEEVEDGNTNCMEEHDLDKGKDKELPLSNKVDGSNSLVRRSSEKNSGSPLVEDYFVESERCLSRIASDNSKDPANQDTPYDFNDEQEDCDYTFSDEEKDDEATLSEEEELAKADSTNFFDEIALLQRESEIPVDELRAKYRNDLDNEVSEDEFEIASALSEDPFEFSEKHKVDKGAEQSGDNSASHDVAELEEVNHPGESDGSKDGENRIADAAAAARSAQPTGNTFSTTKVRTKFPFLLKHPLREYQHIGLDWLVTMYEKRLNGILADEMGLGKTIMTIALLAHLACEKGIWGPHLIIVPTSVMLNWETEFLRWCPAFKILTYFGSAKERRLKRQGWLKQNSFHVCITTYRLVIQDSKVFKRKKWKYLILDEAHLIKNWKSQRWQTLLNFNSKRRILLTGTPLQNDLMELWSLMHFLMPHIFQSHQEFKDWFCNPISGMIEGQERVNKEVIDRLHNVLRPFILRRLKRDVEKQLPLKYEHVINCRLSRRQRNLYEDFIASSETQATLASANFFGMISVIMQLRKVCNHPDLFEGRPIVSSFDMSGIDMQLNSSICSILSPDPFSSVNLRDLGFVFTDLEFSMASWESDETKALAVPENLITDQLCRISSDKIECLHGSQPVLQGTNIFEEIRKAVLKERLKEVRERAASIAWWNSLRCRKKPLYSTTLRGTLTVKHPVLDIHQDKSDRRSYLYSSVLADIVLSPIERFEKMIHLVESFMFAIPATRAPSPVCWCSKSGSSVFLLPTYSQQCAETLLPLLTPIRPAIVRRQVYFPDRRLIQFDCGKLQELAVLLRRLKTEGHRALIFTQMTKMLDILEAFINLYGYTYMRLDGSTQPEERQTLMQRFNTNPKIFLFILSTRSGGVGINLVGADTVIFYDSDWNPAMDQQAQDRCHRIGQTREVHIYRLISESTIEENILKKANQKRALDDLVIQSGGYNTEFFKKLDPMELFSGHRTLPAKNMQTEKTQNDGNDLLVSNAEVEAALKHAEDEADYMALKKVEQEEAVDNQEFTEEAMGKMDDDEPINDEDTKTDEPADHGGLLTKKDDGLAFGGVDITEKETLALAGKEDETDMLDDVKQMAAAAAAAGQAISSFENQLRPIDRYAIRFLEIWDPIIEKSATDSEVRFDEEEWELDRIEKYKEEMEAEIDDNEEPLVYESWDADFATEVYRQQVEALAQHQLMEELECEANEDIDDGDYDSMRDEISSHVKPKAKKKKKAKKSKFKSLKKGSLSSVLMPVKEEPIDEEDFSPEISDPEEFSPVSSNQRKRKKAEAALDGVETKSFKRKPSKKLKKAPIGLGSADFDLYNMLNVGSTEVKASNDAATTAFEQKSLSRSKAGGKISITTMPVKRVLVIKPEKLKKGNIWSKDCVPLPDSWLSQEDAILCAVVHEYGPHWSLVSETLYGMTAGGFYRGRYRHPVHCCERYRELIQRHILSAPENSANEKNNNLTPGKALIKVTEENVKTLLNFAAERPDHELLLQKHFTAILSSVWRTRFLSDRCQNPTSSCNGFPSSGGFLSSFINHSSGIAVEAPTARLKFTSSGQSSEAVAAALVDASNREQENLVSSDAGLENAPVQEKLDITLEIEGESSDPMSHLPAVISLSVSTRDPLSIIPACGNDNHLRSSKALLEDRLREAVRSCGDDGPAWASSAFPTNDFKSRSASKLPSLGKHKLTSSDSSMKPSKSKLKKTSAEHDEAQRLFGGPVISAAAVSPKEPNLRFDLLATLDWDGLGCDTSNHWPSFVNEGPTLESEFLDVVPHDYTPGLISGLDDCSTLPNYTDIG